MILVSKPEWQKAALLPQEPTVESIAEETVDTVSREPVETLPVTSATASETQTQTTELDNSETVDQYACHAFRTDNTSTLSSVSTNVPDSNLPATESNPDTQISTRAKKVPETLTAFPFPPVPEAGASSVINTLPQQPTTPVISTPQILRQAMSLMNNTDMVDLTYVDLNMSEASPSMPRQLFEGDALFTDLFPSPNIHDRKISQSWDRKLEAVNKCLATLMRQQAEMTRMLSYIIQKLNNENSSPPPTINQESQSDTTDLFQSTSSMPVVPTVAATAAPAAAVLSSSVVSQIDEQFSDIPLPYRVPADVLLKKKCEAQSVGNFASALTVLLFPELFTEENLHFKYNYNGVRNGKESLDIHRKNYVQRYMYFYPHLSDVKAYHSSVIDPVNEILRRKNMKVKTHSV